MRFRSLSALCAFAVLASLLLAVSAAGAPSGTADVKSYIVVMAADPLVAYEGGVSGLPATKPAKGKKVNPRSAEARRYRAHLEAQHLESMQEAGVAPARKVHDYAVALNGYSALLTPAQAAEIRSQKNVLRVVEDELQQVTTDSSPQFLGLTGGGNAWQQGYDGRGVVVGVIDTGIWPEHPSFTGAGFPAPPVTGIPCEFGNTTHNANDKPFTCNNKLIGARQELDTYRALIETEDWEFDSARDDNGHGTHTASTAAGNANVTATMLGIQRGKVSGIAPRAHVVAYKGLGALGGFTSDLAGAIDQAVEDGVDVINYSIGGGPSLTGADDIAYLFAADAGVFVATSAGNSGPGPATIGGPASVPWLTTVGANTQKRSFQGTVVLGNGARYTGVSVTKGTATAPIVDAAVVGTGDDPDLCFPGTLSEAAVKGKIVLCRRGVIARVAKSEAAMLGGAVGMIMYENNDAGDLASDPHFVPTVHVDNTPGVAIKAYIGSTANPTARLVTEQIGTFPFAPSTTAFSSRGPNPVAADLIKPDITAPGIQILAGNTPFPGPGSVTGELFQAIAGTSMSSPHVAGVFALLKQAHPDWTAAMAKSAIMTTASQDVRDNDRTSLAGPFARGAGHVNPGKPRQKGSSFDPGLVYDAGLFEYLGFLCDADPSVFVNPAGTCGFLEGNGVPTRAVDLNVPSIGIAELAGTETVKRTVTSVATDNANRTYKPSIDAPAGFEVSISPSSLTLRPGQSATYEVTITNATAPLDEWRFGSIAWESGPYRAYSPVAVKATKFSAPAEITGTGVTGSASFGVKFGYTGAYEARANGLTPATATPSNVKQDPNQTFAPSDAGVGATVHEFALTDAAALRVAIPPEATEAGADLDVFVFDPSGSLAGSSTLGGTNEEVTMVSPANGTWKVYVHGWLAPGGDSDYTLYSWVVPSTTGGSLSVTSAPTSATIGESGTVSVSWTGATGWNLGAVSHMEGSTVLTRTLVEVDNR